VRARVRPSCTLPAAPQEANERLRVEVARQRPGPQRGGGGGGGGGSGRERPGGAGGEDGGGASAAPGSAGRLVDAWDEGGEGDEAALGVGIAEDGEDDK
jgi:hypothetical protein